MTRRLFQIEITLIPHHHKYMNMYLNLNRSSDKKNHNGALTLIKIFKCPRQKSNAISVRNRIITLRLWSFYFIPYYIFLRHSDMTAKRVLQWWRGTIDGTRTRRAQAPSVIRAGRWYAYGVRSKRVRPFSKTPCFLRDL